MWGEVGSWPLPGTVGHYSVSAWEKNNTKTTYLHAYKHCVWELCALCILGIRALKALYFSLPVITNNAQTECGTL
jgi:hypothetical protein